MDKVKYRNLEGLRGLAALVVVFWHYSLAFLPATAGYGALIHFRHERLFSATPLHILVAGPSAVSLFFVLSGFVLSLAYFKVRDSSVLASGALRRYFRLMIPALGSILITYIVLAFGLKLTMQTSALTGSGWLHNMWNFPVSFFDALWQGIYSLFFLRTNLPTMYNVNLWTMPYELFGSFIVFMFLAIFGKLQKRWLVYIALVLVFAQSYYLGFILGVALADLWSTRKALMLRLLPARINIPMLAVGLILLAYYAPANLGSLYAYIMLPGYTTTTMGILVQAIGGALVIMAVLSNGLISRFFESKPLQFLGKISFSLYLLHLVVLGTVACFLFNQFVGRIGYGWALVATCAITLPITFGIAALYTKYVDSSAIAFSRFFSNYVLSAKRKQATAQTIEPQTEELPENGLATTPASATE